MKARSRLRAASTRHSRRPLDSRVRRQAFPPVRRPRQRNVRVVFNVVRTKVAERPTAGRHTRAREKARRSPQGAYCAIALAAKSGLPLGPLSSLAQTFSISTTTFFGIGT